MSQYRIPNFGICDLLGSQRVPVNGRDVLCHVLQSTSKTKGKIYIPVTRANEIINPNNEVTVC